MRTSRSGETASKLIRGLVDIALVTIEVHDAGLELVERCGLRLSLRNVSITATAPIGNCDVVWSQHMQTDCGSTAGFGPPSFPSELV